MRVISENEDESLKQRLFVRKFLKTLDRGFSKKCVNKVYVFRRKTGWESLNIQWLQFCLSYWHTNIKTTLIHYWAQAPEHSFKGLSCNCTQGKGEITKITRKYCYQWADHRAQTTRISSKIIFKNIFHMQNSYLQQFSKLDRERNQPSALVN